MNSVVTKNFRLAELQHKQVTAELQRKKERNWKQVKFKDTVSYK